MGLKRLLSVVLSSSLLISAVASTASVAEAAEVRVETSNAETSWVSSANDYGLAENIQDGVILHCFDWKYNDIKAELPNIAEAGFTAVQTSPAQRDSSYGVWYMMYQPQSFSISTNALGTKEDLKSLCDEAEKYGVKIVVDVVANHLRGDGYDVDADLSRGSHPQFFHGNNSGIDYNNRYSITHNDLGMADLNSENEELQRIVAGYISELQSVGVDGVRWDAAKHIGLPSESCNFWPKVTEQGLWHYGEILDSPGGDGAALMKEYTQYISVTDGGNNGYCAQVRNAINGGSTTGSIGNWCAQGVSKNKLVYWGESHDDYSNNGQYGVATQHMNQNVIDRAYAVLAAQGEATSLYFSRPGSTDKERIMAGAKGSTHFTSPEVAEVNKFHNAMIGKKDYYSNGGNVCSITRQGGGAVVVKASGSGNVTVANGGGYCPSGTYTDAVSGNTFTVTDSTISGNVGDSGIAVLYNAVKKPSATATPGDSSFVTDTLSVTLGLKNAASGSYETSEGDKGSFTDGQKITIGSKTKAGSKITLTLTAVGEDETTTKTYTYTYTKRDPSAVTMVYFDNSTTKWSNVYCYIYNPGGTVDSDTDTSGGDDPGSAGGTIYFTDNAGWGSVNAYFFSDSATDIGGGWPGSSMTNVGDDGFGNQKFSISVPSGATKVVFNNGSDQTEDVTLGSNTGFYTDGSRDGKGHLVVKGNVAASAAKAPQKSAAAIGVASGVAESNAAWPGTAMTVDSGDIYSYVVPDNLVNGCVIFSDGSDGSTAGSQIPAQDEPRLELGGTSHIYQNGKWTEVSNHTDTDTETDTETDTDSEQPTTKVLLGDATLDKKISLRDATACQRHALNIKKLTGEALLSGDVDGNGEITITDAVNIQKYIVKIAVSFKIGEYVYR